VQYLKLTETRRQEVNVKWFFPQLLPHEYGRYMRLEVGQGPDSWLIHTDCYSGIIPLSSEYGIQIWPKAGLKNLTYMLYRSGLLNRSLQTPFDQVVPYEIPEDDLESFFEGLVNSFLYSLDEIKRWGLLRQVKTELVQGNSVRGKIDYNQWLVSYSKNLGLPIPHRVFVADLDNLPNRILLRCLDYLIQTGLKYVPVADVIARRDYFGKVAPVFVSHDEMQNLDRFIEAGRCPSDRYYYLPALNLALLIMRGAGLGLGDDADVRFKPILINTAEMFERYVRAIAQEVSQTFDAHADNGKLEPLRFYSEPPFAISVKPDIVVKRGGRTVMVIDVKYKFAPTEQDHYQLWAYMEAYDVKHGGFISVRDKPNPNPAITWFKRGEYSVFDYSFDCGNIAQSEAEFDLFLSHQLRLLSQVA
jgi:5-methylcytosine-specific restriction endonuclease McrBC regulatory subunit McrC